MQMICKVFGVPRSTFYFAQRSERRGRKKRGPKTQVADEELIAVIREEIRSSPFQGEGYRKVWVRLRSKGWRVGKNRVLRLMRQERLLAPTRRRHLHGDKAHQGTIVTERPDQMWGTDGTRFWTEEEGWCWWFGCVDHCVGEVVGWTVAKVGDRFAALEPVRQGVRSYFGQPERDVARGLSLRFDLGPQYTSADFQREIRFFGIQPSPAFPEEPETNGIMERFIRTLKEQCLWVHRFRNLEEARQKLGQFITLYNQGWLIQRLGYLSPLAARSWLMSPPVALFKPSSEALALC